MYYPIARNLSIIASIFIQGFNYYGLLWVIKIFMMVQLHGYF